MLLSPLHVLNRELRRGMGERRSQLLLIHDSLLSSCAGLSGMTHAAERPGLIVKHNELDVRSRFDYLLVESTGLSESLPVAEPRLGRRTVLTFPLLPPPQK